MRTLAAHTYPKLTGVPEGDDIKKHFEKQSRRVGVSLRVDICILMNNDLLVIGQFQRPRRFKVMLLAVKTRESD